MKRTMKLASRNRRFVAGLIDAAVPILAYFVMTAIYGKSLVSSQDPFGYGYGYGYGYNFDYNYNMPIGRGAVLAIFILGILMIGYVIAEFILYARAQSIGKAILGLQVVSSKDGKPFGFWKMVLRECIVKGASSSVFMLGYIWILLDDKNRGWHDKILDSYVVDLKETAEMHQRTASSVQESANEEEIFRERREDAVEGDGHSDYSTEKDDTEIK